MNITEEHRATLHNTLELAKGIRQIDSMINPRKESSETKGLINRVSREIESLHPKRGVINDTYRSQSRFLKKSPKSQENSGSTRSSYKKKLSKSIKSINNRLKLSKAGKSTMGKLMNDHNLSFSDSVEKSISKECSPCPKALPVVSLSSGKTSTTPELPEFKDYLRLKGSDYLNSFSKKDENSDLISRFEKASEKISKFKEFLEAKTKNMFRQVVRKSTKETFLSKSTMKKNKSTEKQRRDKDGSQPKISNSIQNFRVMKQRENQKFLDIINRIDLERPKLIKEKANLIQRDKERFRDHIYSLHKFDGFRAKVENSLKDRQELSKGQGEIYMKIIEDFRTNKYRPDEGEIEILEIWRKMIGYGWAISLKDMEDIRKSLKSRNISSQKTENLLKKFSSIL